LNVDNNCLQTWIRDLLIQDQDQDQDSAVLRPRPRPRLWSSRPRTRSKLVKTGLEKSRDQDSNLENSKSNCLRFNVDTSLTLPPVLQEVNRQTVQNLA